MTRVQAFPVISVDAWSRTYATDASEGWDAVTLTRRDRLFAEQLRGKLDIRELKTGFEIATTSHVGYIPFERFAVRIQPAISHLDMLRMMQYAYNIDDLTAYERMGLTATTDFAPEQLVAAWLAVHVRQLIRRGLFQTWKRPSWRPCGGAFVSRS